MPGHISVYVKDAKTLIAGDALVVEHGKLCCSRQEYVMSQKQTSIPTYGFLRLPQILAIIPISKSAWWKGCRNGAYSSVAFDTPTTQAVITRTYGGWARLCTECNASSFRREFARTWVAYCRQGVRLFGHLPGITEKTNRKNGFYDHIPPPELIGKPKLARFVLNPEEEYDMNSNSDAEEAKASS